MEERKGKEGEASAKKGGAGEGEGSGGRGSGGEGRVWVDICGGWVGVSVALGRDLGGAGVCVCGGVWEGCGEGLGRNWGTRVELGRTRDGIKEKSVKCQNPYGCPYRQP